MFFKGLENLANREALASVPSCRLGAVLFIIDEDSAVRLLGGFSLMVLAK